MPLARRHASARLWAGKAYFITEVSMSRQVRLIALVAFVSALVAVVVRAQAVSDARPQSPVIMTGSDLGFRVDHLDGDVPVGELVVKRNGEWVPVRFAAALKRMK
jgi:hypothetical protein